MSGPVKYIRGDDEPVWGWCARCQTHTYFPHDCPGDGQVKDEDSEPGPDK